MRQHMCSWETVLEARPNHITPLHIKKNSFPPLLQKSRCLPAQTPYLCPKRRTPGLQSTLQWSRPWSRWRWSIRGYGRRRQQRGNNRVEEEERQRQAEEAEKAWREAAEAKKVQAEEEKKKKAKTAAGAAGAMQVCCPDCMRGRSSKDVGAWGHQGVWQWYSEVWKREGYWKACVHTVSLQGDSEGLDWITHWEKGFILNLGICIGKWMNI